MNILAIDTATMILSAALSSSHGVWSFEIDAGMTHAESLMPLIDTLVTNAGIGRTDIAVVSCMRGPGSFTGLRIGFAAAKGLSLALRIPLASVPTLDCMAAPYAAWPGTVLPVIDAKKHRYFTALFRGGTRLSPDMDVDGERIAALLESDDAPSVFPVLLTGIDAELLAEEAPIQRLSSGGIVLDPARRRGRARELLAIAEQFAMIEEVDDPTAGPRYLRKSDAELQGEGGLRSRG